MNPPEARWMFELRSICSELHASYQIQGNAVTVRAEQTVLRLTDFQNHLFVNVGLQTGQGPHWVGFLIVARSELTEFLGNVLPPPRCDPADQIQSDRGEL
jgi:GTP-dependent phosphoenolpyruvate carboxykinase